ncbi:hypothetical protein AC579_1853 [Pseudocercospora musae]|uniref:Uncharacterized protein n=1 Tax=Pseudocercospora musae TaxID=113226 RepID=A0A139IBH7_9PEZI|nr:hypothetical protein AC579_1853 [Pseudocercospora musae]
MPVSECHDLCSVTTYARPNLFAPESFKLLFAAHTALPLPSISTSALMEETRWLCSPPSASASATCTMRPVNSFDRKVEDAKPSKRYVSFLPRSYALSPAPRLYMMCQTQMGISPKSNEEKARFVSLIKHNGRA